LGLNVSSLQLTEKADRRCGSMFTVLSPAGLIRRRSRQIHGKSSTSRVVEKVPNVRPSIPKNENLQHLSPEGRIILKCILREKY